MRRSIFDRLSPWHPFFCVCWKPDPIFWGQRQYKRGGARSTGCSSHPQRKGMKICFLIYLVLYLQFILKSDWWHLLCCSLFNWLDFLLAQNLKLILTLMQIQLIMTQWAPFCNLTPPYLSSNLFIWIAFYFYHWLVYYFKGKTIPLLIYSTIKQQFKRMMV